MRAVPPEARVFEVGALIHLEIAVDRVERDNGCQQRGISRPTGNEIPFGHQLTADAAADGSLHLGEFDIEPHRFDSSTRCLDGLLSLTLVSGSRVHFLLGNGA